jgi:hypothetical protein
VASIAGPRIAEIKVRHHARQFGQSKYGLSRIYKVLLDLMVIKTVASFTARPLLWFTLLSAPFAILGSIALTYALFSWATDAAPLSLPIAGSGAVLLMCSLILVLGGVLAEAIYKLGDLREDHLARLTGRLWTATGTPDRGLPR